MFTQHRKLTGSVCGRQCSSGLQAVADVAAAIKAGFYTIGIGAGVETMSKNPMAWEGGVNPRIAESKDAQNCLVPMGANTAPLTVTTLSCCIPTALTRTTKRLLCPPMWSSLVRLCTGGRRCS